VSDDYGPFKAEKIIDVLNQSRKLEETRSGLLENVNTMEEI